MPHDSKGLHISRFLDPIIIDAITKAIRSISSDHALNHKGYGYNAFISLSNLAPAASKSYCLTAPLDRFMHIKNMYITTFGASIRVEILKGAEVTANEGAAVPFINTNDNSPYEATAVLKEDPTYSGGDLWNMAEAYANTTNQSAGNATMNQNSDEEIISKNGETNYIIKITNIHSTDTVTNAFIKMFMYEELKGLVD